MLRKLLLRAGYLPAGKRVHLLVRERRDPVLPLDLAQWWLTRADGGADALFDPAERILSVTAGRFSDGRTSGLRFRDASSLSSDPLVRILQLLDHDRISRLPLFTGNAVLESSGIDTATRVDTFSPIPEPPTLAIVALAVCGLLLLVRHADEAKVRS